MEKINWFLLIFGLVTFGVPECNCVEFDGLMGEKPQPIKMIWPRLGNSKELKAKPNQPLGMAILPVPKSTPG